MNKLAKAFKEGFEKEAVTLGKNYEAIYRGVADRLGVADDVINKYIKKKKDPDSLYSDLGGSHGNKQMHSPYRELQRDDIERYKKLIDDPDIQSWAKDIDDPDALKDMFLSASVEPLEQTKQTLKNRHGLEEPMSPTQKGLIGGAGLGTLGLGGLAYQQGMFSNE